MIEAIILAGGLGTRLTLLSSPKALAPIQGTPFLQLLLSQLEKANILSKVVMALGHKADAIECFLQNKKYGFDIEASLESSPLGTGGAILHALPKTTSKTLLVLNGDSHFDISFTELLSFHQARQADATVACREVDDTSRYGAVEITTSQRISAFREKASVPQKGWINGGIYLFQREIFEAIPPGSYSLEKDFFPQFLYKNLFAYPHTGSFIDIGTNPSYLDAQEVLKPWINQ